MRFRSLDIHLEQRLVGVLFQYGQGANAITRLQPEPGFWLDPQAPVLSWSARFADAADRATFVAQHAVQPFFNGQGERLPTFFQNLLPEGPLRRHLEQLRGCAPDDHFDLLAMCGDDLPGAVRATPSAQSRLATAAIVTQHQDALEASVVDDPVAGAVSLSGIQPKLGLVEAGGRYVARTRADGGSGVHIIAKLPAVDYALLPEVEALSLQLAQAAGVQVCRASLRPVSDIELQDTPFALHTGAHFLAVERFDRAGARHIHCEDFAQVLGLDPLDKYQDPQQRANYAALLLTLRESMGLGDEAAHELLRRLMVNEMLGNYDAHVKNFGVVYADGRTPALSPAYDVVAYAAYLGGRGHALRFFPGAPDRAQLTPTLVRQLCNAAGLLETRVRAVLRETVERALQAWPALIEASPLLPEQKARLLAHFQAVPAVQAVGRRRGRVPAR
ncbi:type II toxin-antitoxin system HipA family toxin [Hydrogenophaga sp.]|uniref:type II toxin-antitoxin system HipA family toxin n=1 Tax=Hydrogenophaga sp. TaxID=1904254 RepID=UPI0026158081|nr:type II toxin-antitoxin system HipA family toxin [Hydrogenophaga sp.]MCW5655586.1 type II toxin-antitoxin system HipA family toxin [Hydrogenophaga sp.]